MKKQVMRMTILLVVILGYMISGFQFCLSQDVQISDAKASVGIDGYMDVSGTINSGGGRLVTVLILDPKYGLEYSNSIRSMNDGRFRIRYAMTNQLPGTYIVKLGGMGVYEPVMLKVDYHPLVDSSNSDQNRATITNAVATVDAKGQVDVTGGISSGAGREVATVITDPDGKLHYAGVVTSTSGGQFDFSYEMKEPKAGDYQVRIGGLNVKTPVNLVFTYGGKGIVAELSMLKLQGAELAVPFDRKKKNYEVHVPDSVDCVGIIASSSDRNAMVQFDRIAGNVGSSFAKVSLVSGKNEVDITVTAQDGITTSSYRIEIFKGSAITDVSASIDKDKRVTVQGKITTGADKGITLTITDPKGKMEYVDSVMSELDGCFAFSYFMQNETAGAYQVKIGGKSVKEAAKATFDYIPPSGPSNHNNQTDLRLYAIGLDVEMTNAIVPSVRSAAAGTVITLSVSPNIGFNYTGVTFKVLDKTTGILTVLQGNTFEMPASDVEITAHFDN